MNIFIGLLLVGLVAGIAGGMFGIGGGAIMVPAMVLLLGMDQKFATGTSLGAQVLPIGILAAMVYYKEGRVDIKYSLLIAAGLVVGNLLGALFANQESVSSDTIKKMYGVFMVLIGLRYLLEGKLFFK